MNAGLARTLGDAALALLTLALALTWAFPLGWALLETLAPLEPGASWPDGVRLYAEVIFGTRIGLWFLNSLITAGGVTVIVLMVSATCGYAISQLRFSGRRLLWAAILASFMVPVQALIVNHFFLMFHWGLINTWLGVILPQLITPLAVIVYKQAFDAVPRELHEAGRMDNAPEWKILFRIYLPLNLGITASLAIIIFIGAWNAFLWPFLAVTRPEMMNVTVALVELRSGLRLGDLASAIVVCLPVVILYLVLQRRVTRAVALSAGLKG